LVDAQHTLPISICFSQVPCQRRMARDEWRSIVKYLPKQDMMSQEEIEKARFHLQCDNSFSIDGYCLF
jgi:hypothetical protein